MPDMYQPVLEDEDVLVSRGRPGQPLEGFYLVLTPPSHSGHR